MEHPRILYWKWDDTHLETGKYRDQIADIVRRSCFSHVYITTHWCRRGLSDPATRGHLRRAGEALHKAGRRMVLEIDLRAEKAGFAAAHPEARAGFAYWQSVPASAGTCTYRIRGGEGGCLFGGDRQSGDALLAVTAYRTGAQGRVIPGSLQPLTETARLTRLDRDEVRVDWDAAGLPEDARVFAAVWSLFDFPDLFSDAYYTESDRLMAACADLPADGAALDELCFMWHPDFDFTPGSYMTLDNCPIYTPAMARAYAAAFGAEYLEDMLYRFVSDAGDPRRIAAVNRYFHCLREGIAAAENHFYGSVKATFGPDAFVGVHNTWFAIEEVQNSPEIWRTGITWWSARKDYGFTDEIMQFPVRTALAHKAGAPLFYNMWYSEATMELRTFYTEIWRNVRHGGRTISLSYECVHEDGTVQQLCRPGQLEAVSAMEERIRGLDDFVQSPARCDVAVVPSLAALCSRLCNLDGNGRWDGFSGKLKEVFTLTRDLSAAGWNCDLIGDNEIYAGHLAVGPDGYLAYGNQRYTCLILFCPQYARRELLPFVEQVRDSRTRLLFIGHADTDFDGRPLSDPAGLAPEAPCFAYRPEIGDVAGWLRDWGIETNQVPGGCIMQDGTVILTAPAPDRPTGNAFASRFLYRGRRITVSGSDVAALRLDENGAPVYWPPETTAVQIDETDKEERV